MVRAGGAGWADALFVQGTLLMGEQRNTRVTQEIGGSERQIKRERESLGVERVLSSKIDTFCS